MESSNLQTRFEPKEPGFLGFLDFPHLPSNSIQNGRLRLNKYSSNLTRGHDFPGAQVRKTVPG